MSKNNAENTSAHHSKQSGKDEKKELSGAVIAVILVASVLCLVAAYLLLT